MSPSLSAVLLVHLPCTYFGNKNPCFKNATHTHHSAGPQQHLQERVGSIVFVHPCIFSDNGEVLDVFRSKSLSYSVPLGSLVLLSLHSALGFTFCSCVSNAHSFQNWHYGFVFINGRNLGRYRDIGPQRTLYLPGPWLHPEDNEVSYLTLPQGVINF